MRRFNSLWIPILLIVLVLMALQSPPKMKILYCYGKFKPELVIGYDLVVVEAAHFFPSNVRVLKANNKKVIAYISLGEVNRYAAHFEKLQQSTLGKNEIWDSYYLDIRKEQTQSTLLQLMKGLFDQGYDGLFLDNFDNFNQWGPQKEHKEAFIAFVKRIRDTYPDKFLIQNAGIELVPQTFQWVDALAVESVVTDYDFNAKRYRLRAAKQYQPYREELLQLYAKFKLPTHLIEYAESSELKNHIAKELEDTPFDFFIGSISLQKLPQNTK